MALERKDNDEQMEKLRVEADDVAAKVSQFFFVAVAVKLIFA